jgi:chitinase
MRKYLLPLSIALVVFIAGCKKNDATDPAPTPPPVVVIPPTVTPPVTYTPDNSFKIVAYFPSYRSPDSISAAKYKMITHLFYAFLVPNKDGSLKALDQPSRFNQVMALGRSNGVKVGISVSTADSVFSAMATTAATRTLFVKNVVNFAATNNLDGVDLDWEYPRTTTGTDITYAALVKELADSLHKKNKYLSAAITPAVYAGSVRDGIKAEVFGYADFFNIMVYDGLGWDSADLKQHSSYKMANSSLDIWLTTKGMPKNKAVLGMPLYGKNAANSSKGYRDLINTGAKADKDSTTSAGQLYYYNGTETIKKKALLAKDRANGMMFWEFYFDTNNSTSLIKAANDAIGRPY